LLDQTATGPTVNTIGARSAVPPRTTLARP